MVGPDALVVCRAHQGLPVGFLLLQYSDFRIHFRYVIVHAKTTLMYQGGFKPKWPLQFFIEYKAI